MSNIVNLKPNTDIATGLRNIAKEVEGFEKKGITCTLVISSQVYHLGDFNDDMAAANAICNLQYGIYKLMKYTDALDDEEN